jgi:predicted cytidylate kinase
MIITISGSPGSGKSTVGRILAKRRGCPFISIGDLLAGIAEKKGLTLEELNRIAETEDWVDKARDDELVRFGKEHKDAVIDARLGWFFLPESLKIFITVDPRIGAERVFRDQRADEARKESIEDTMKMQKERQERDRKRYIHYYGADMLDMENYDLVLDSTGRTPHELADEIASKSTS